MNTVVYSETELKNLAARLAALLSGNETIELVGDVGAGKTTFIKGLAKGLGVSDEVQSPSYTINRLYDTASGGQLSHYDFYRLSEPGIIANEIAEAVADPTTIVAIEWADSVSGVLPEERITLTIRSISDTEREVTITGLSDQAEKTV